MKKEILKKLIELAENNPEEWFADSYTISIRGITIWTVNRPYGDMRFYRMPLVKKENMFNYWEKNKLKFPSF